MNKYICDIYNLIQELSWHFGNHGFDGECCGDLSLVEFMALKKIYESNNITVKEVGNALGCTKSGSSKIIDRLESKGYVLRKTSSADGRVCCVNATAKGADRLGSIIKGYTAYVDNMLSDFNPETIDNIKSVLEMLIESAKTQRKGDIDK